MKPGLLAFVLLSVAATLLGQTLPVSLFKPLAAKKLSSPAAQADPAIRSTAVATYGRLPLAFEANQGQINPQVKFLSRGVGYSLFLTPTEAVLTLGRVSHQKPGSAVAKALPPREEKSAVLRMKLVGANAKTQLFGQDELPGKSNYFRGNDPKKWHTDVPTYAKVKYEGIYPGVDLVYYGNQRQLEYDFIVAPGADPRRIQFDVRGANRIRRDEHGDLVLKMGEDEIRWHKPIVYQEKDGARRLVAARYDITDAMRVGFKVAEYDARRPLYIDPLIYSTFLGRSGDDIGHGIAVDGAGNTYITGETGSADFPTTSGAFQRVCNGGNGCWDAFVAKLNPGGSALVYSTYLGGGQFDAGFDAGHGIAVDSAGNAYVTGIAASTDFPTTPGAFQTVCGGISCSDAFVTKLNPKGTDLVYSTYLGGSGAEDGVRIALDGAGNAYVAGSTDSTDFPTKNPWQPTYGGGGSDAFVAKINATGSALVYSTYLGGSDRDGAADIAVDSSGRAYVTGVTESTDFPTMNPLQGANAGSADVFVAKLNSEGSALVYSTYLGGSLGDVGKGIAVDGAGNAYVTGEAGPDFPTKNPLQTYAGGADAFVAKLNPEGSALVYSTYLGGAAGDTGSGIAVDSGGRVYVSGWTSSYNFPTKDPVQARFGGPDDDGFVASLNAAGSALVYSTYLGGSGEDMAFGIAVESGGSAHIIGFTASANFPIKRALQASWRGWNDAFVAKIDMRVVTRTTVLSSLNPSIYGQAVTFTAVVTSNLGAPPDGETVAFEKGGTVLGTGALSGGSASFTTSALPVGKDSIKAVYGGDLNFAGSTAKVVQVVNKATTTTTLASSQNPSNFGQSVTFTASVAPQFSGTVTGTVTFYDGATALKTASLSGGAAKFTTSTLTSGTHTITATYNGSSKFIGSSASLTQTVN